LHGYVLMLIQPFPSGCIDGNFMPSEELDRAGVSGHDAVDVILDS